MASLHLGPSLSVETILWNLGEMETTQVLSQRSLHGDMAMMGAGVSHVGVGRRIGPRLQAATFLRCILHELLAAYIRYAVEATHCHADHG